MRYSHAGLSLRGSPETPWAVRQLYYACDEKLPRLFDQGIAAFLMGTDDARLGYISLVFLPAPQADALERAALDNRRALQLLGADYSANAYPFSQRYQNCNQWLVELLASAWGGAAVDAAGAPGPEAAGTEEAGAAATPRARAQRWLQASGYGPARVELGFWLMLASTFVPWVRHDDHPLADLERQRFHVSMPEPIEAFVRRVAPGATRVELCHAGERVVVRRGWGAPIADGCAPGDGDEVLALP